jgi:metallo-beta-lactamase family protein
MKVTFLGAARTVTGSQYLIELPTARLLVDCGLYQGHEAELVAGMQRFAFDPASIDHVLLTHAHIDHCGLLPRLWKLGFRGKIHCTSATRDLCEALLADSAKIQEEDAAWDLRKWRKGQHATPPPAPLYTMEDAAAVMEHFRGVSYDEDVAIAEGVFCRWVDAGHILGAASLELWLSQDGVRRKLVFSGDVGMPDRPILRDPTLIDSADFVVVESTYGNRDHPPEEQIAGKLADAIRSTVRANGHVIVPAFAVGRTQELLYRLDQLLTAGAIPKVPVYVDSPLASKATRVFEEHHECYDTEALRMLGQGDNPIRFPSLKFTQSVSESMALNDVRQPVIIISAAGMCNAGRIRHHLHHHLEHGNDTILFVGFQAQGTLGRLLVERVPQVTLFGRRHRVRAKICSIRGLSAHADRTHLLQWTEAIRGPRCIIVTHGEEEPSLSFAKLLRDRGHQEVWVPRLRDTFDLLAPGEQAERVARTAAELASYPFTDPEAHEQRPEPEEA